MIVMYLRVLISLSWVMGLVIAGTPEVLAAESTPIVPAMSEQGGQGFEVVSPDTNTSCYGVEVIIDEDDVRNLAAFVWCNDQSPVTASLGVVNLAGQRTGPVWCGLPDSENSVTCSWNLYIVDDGRESVVTKHIRLGAKGHWEWVEEPAAGPRYSAFWP